jgi:predicted Zn finger-like uncharacterized protein
LLTQCPNCETTFRVTAEILRVADGQVRCGRCHTQFDAIARLIEEGDPNEALSGRYLQTQLRQPDEPEPEPERDRVEVDEPDVEEITLEGRRIEISGTYRVVDEDDASEPHVRRETVEEWVEIGEDDEQAPQADDETQDSEEQRDAGAAIDEAIAPEEPIIAAEPLRPTRAPLGYRQETDEESTYDDLEFAPTRTRTPLIWKVLVVPLALLLIVQVAHHYRAELARHPLLGSHIMRAYEALGLRLTPDWNLHAYGVKQWGVVMDPATPGTLRVRATITNTAAYPQPYPLLKLVLEDRWGDQVRAREFEPSEYADPGTASDRLLAPGQQTNATISIVDPGPDAEGFRFDVCLRGKAGPVCAAEVPSAR